MNPKHSPAPWSVHPYRDGKLHEVKSDSGNFKSASISIGSGEVLIGEFTHFTNAKGFPSPSFEEMQANARLAISAPELLEALEASVRFAEQWLCAYHGSMIADARDTMLEKARATIAKAKGEA